METIANSSTIQNSKLDEWREMKVFRDTVHQYIEMPKAYVSYLIDTYYMQRIKNVAQSGLRSVYNAATHDRFSHSLGVYYLGHKAFHTLRKNILNVSEKECFIYQSQNPRKIQDVLGEINFNIKDELDIYELLFDIACILHDIGHPSMSHTLEFLYDDIYMSLENEEPITVSYDEYKRYTDLRNKFISGYKKIEFREKLAAKLSANKIKIDYESLEGNPHERMSAYYILMGISNNTIISSSLAENIKNLINSYFSKVLLKEQPTDTVIIEYLRFICRMIIGQKFETEIISDKDISECFCNSIKNAVINLLNGKIDVDSLDYIARNSYSSGYDTNNIDINRMCTAYSVRLQNNILVPVFEKNALSVLEGFISARNYEPSWLYSHHKIVYSIDVLYKCLYKCTVEMLYKQDLHKWCSVILENFFGRNKSLCSNDFYNEHIKNGNKKNTSDDIDINAILNIFTPNALDIENKLINLKNSDNISTKRLATLVYDKFMPESSLYKSGEIKSELTSIIKDNEELIALEDDIIQYISEKQKAYNVMTVVMQKANKDIIDSEFSKIMEQSKQYLTTLSEKDINQILTNKKLKEEFIEFFTTLSTRYSELIDIKNLYFSYILSPLRCFENGTNIFNRSNDYDIDALFKMLYTSISYKRTEDKTETEQTYELLAKEYFNRSYKRSLWKSYQEYKIFLTSIADELNMTYSDINRYFIELIKNGGKEVLFHNDNYDEINSSFNTQKIYTYYSSEEISRRKDASIIMKFDEIISDLKEHNMIIRIHKTNYKNFGESIKIAYRGDIFELNKVIDITDNKPREFPYIFISLEESERSGNTLDKLKESLREKLERYFSELHEQQFNTKREISKKTSYDSDGKLFRDVVHGDIFIPKRFLALVETQAFQRMRRIKQLSTADLVFPNAAHTRFAHCIGTFYIMNLIVEHFKGIFTNMGLDYKEEDIDALLIAALLHDIGHGPYSHNFERIHENQKKHEIWSAEIIENDQEICEVLKKEFKQYDTKAFIQLINSYIIDDESSDNSNVLSFHTIFKSLISSQMDADRFDYLLRDSFNTGIVYGNIDINAIIQGMKVTEYKNNFYVCISENTVSYVEQFLFGRYKMYDNVYYSGYKVFSETLVLKILKYAYSLGIKNDLISENLSLQNYIKLDDTYINGLFNEWQKSENPVLSRMCKSLLHRKGYSRVYAMNQTKSDFISFKQEITKIINKYLPQRDFSIDNFNGFIVTDREFTAYEYITASGNDLRKYNSKIFVLTNDGLLKDFAEASPMFSPNGSNNWKTYKCYIYYNKDLFAEELDLIKDKFKDYMAEKKSLLREIDNLIRNLDPRNHIEIEEKYTCTSDELEKIEAALMSEKLNMQYSIEGPQNVNQLDIYFDTDERIFVKKQCSLRYRYKGNNKYKITIKIPTANDGFDKNSQVARFEYEQEIPTEYSLDASENKLPNDILDGTALKRGYDFIYSTLKDSFPDLIAGMTKENIFLKLKPILNVKNKRNKYFIKSKGDGAFKFCVCIDRVTFIKDEKEEKDYQIEVELESDYIHRVSMKFFTKEIERLLGTSVRHEQSSKYIKGLKMLKLI